MVGLAYLNVYDVANILKLYVCVYACQYVCKHVIADFVFSGLVL